MTNQASKMLRILVFGLSFVMLTAAAHAQTNVWTGPAAGDWGDPANWSLGEVPLAQFIPPDPLDVSVRIDANPGQDSSVLLEGTRSVGSLQIDAGDTLTIVDGATLAVGSVLNSGSIYLVDHDQGPFPSNGLRTVGTLVNAPGGLLSLDNGRYSSYFRQKINSFLNQSVTEGYGSIVNLSIQNDGLIDANVAGEQLTLQGKSPNPFSSGLSFLRNSGTMRASNGGMLRLVDWLRDGIYGHDGNTSGTIEAWGDSTVLIERSLITGGRIATSNQGGIEEGEILFPGGFLLRGVELDARARFVGSSSISNSNFANKKTLTLDGENLSILGTNFLYGGGIFKLSGNSAVQSFNAGNQTNPKLVNVDNTILVPQGSTVTFGKKTLVENRGIIEANGPSFSWKPSLTLDLNGPDYLALGEVAWTNSGIIRAVNGADIFFKGNTNTNDIFIENTDGVIEVGEGSQMNFSSFEGIQIRGGTLRGPVTVPVSTPPFNTPSYSFTGEAILENVRLEGAVSWQQKVTLVGTIVNTGLLKSDRIILRNSDEVTLAGEGDFSISRVEQSSAFSGSPSKLINENKLRMDGSVTFAQVDFTNRGAVEASNTGTTSFLRLEDFTTTSPTMKFVNSGVVRATSGATLEINVRNSSIQNYEVDNFGNVLPGTIYAGAGSEVRLTSVSGGVLHAAEGGIIRIINDRFFPAYLNSLDTPAEMHLLGRIEAENLSLTGTIHNDGQLVVTGDINASRFPAIAPPRHALLTGNGELQLLNGTLHNYSNSTFFNGPDHTIIGGGAILSEAGFFTNEGRIEANEGNTLTLTHTGPVFLFQQRGELVSSGNGILNIEYERLFTNQGTVRVAADATTHFIGDLSSSSQQFVNASGAEIVVDGQLFVKNSDLVNEAGATVTGDGRIELVPEPQESPRFFNNGTLAPGSSVGQLTIAGDYVQSATGDLEIELGGRLPEEYDSLSAGSADLAGLLEVSLVDLGGGEFAPGLGDSFEIVDASISGEFDMFLLPTLASDLAWGIQYNPESVVLEILAPLQTDFDADGDVDSNDFLLVQRDDPSLISQWQAEYGSRVITSLTSTQTVPEPSTALLAIGAFATLATLQRKEKHLSIPG